MSLKENNRVQNYIYCVILLFFIGCSGSGSMDDMMVPDNFEPTDFFCGMQDTDTLSCEDLLCANRFGGNGTWELWRFWNYSNYETIGGTVISFERGGIYKLDDNEGSPTIRGFYKLLNDCEQIIFEGISSPFMLDTFEVITLDAQKLILQNDGLCADTCLLVAEEYSGVAWSKHCDLVGENSDFYPCEDCPFGRSGVKCDNEYFVTELESELIDIIELNDVYCLKTKNGVSFVSKSNLKELFSYDIPSDGRAFDKVNSTNVIYTTRDSIYIFNKNGLVQSTSFEPGTPSFADHIYFNDKIYMIKYDVEIYSINGQFISSVDQGTSIFRYRILDKSDDNIILQYKDDLVFIDEDGFISNEADLGLATSSRDLPMTYEDGRLYVLTLEGFLQCYDNNFSLVWEKNIKPDVFDWVDLEEDRLEEARIISDGDLIVVFLEGAVPSIPDRSIVSKYFKSGKHHYTTDLSISNISFEEGPYGITCTAQGQDNMDYIGRIYREGSQGILKVKMSHEVNESRVDVCIW